MTPPESSNHAWQAVRGRLPLIVAIMLGVAVIGGLVCGASPGASPQTMRRWTATSRRIAARVGGQWRPSASKTISSSNLAASWSSSIAARSRLP